MTKSRITRRDIRRGEITRRGGGGGKERKNERKKKKHGGRQLIAVRINSLDVFIRWRSGKVGLGRAINCQGLNSRFYESIRKNKQTLCVPPRFTSSRCVCRWLFQRADIYLPVSFVREASILWKIPFRN